MRTAIQEAFARINNPPLNIKAALNKVLKEQNKKKDKGWDAKLSFRTYQQLKADGVLA
jgi:hypothetical protein